MLNPCMIRFNIRLEQSHPIRSKILYVNSYIITQKHYLTTAKYYMKKSVHSVPNRLKINSINISCEIRF